MRAKLINEKFEEDSDPIKDLKIGMINKLHKLCDALNDGYISWDDIDYDEEDLTIKCYSRGFSDPNDFHNPAGGGDYDWEQVGVTEDFEEEITINIDLLKNTITASYSFTNPDISDFSYEEENYLGIDVQNESVENIMDAIEDEYNSYDVFDAANDAWDSAGGNDIEENEECEECGEELDEDGLCPDCDYCPECGEQLDDRDEPCENCAEENEDDE